MLLTFDEAGARGRAEVGGKAAWLARLAAAGLPVPPGLVVPVEVFRDFLERNGLWDAARRGDPGLDAAILAGRLDPAFAGRLRTEAARLGDRLAVRSSAVDEDERESSFAGQYETVLGVSPGDETEAALLRCWASAYGQRARAYRKGEVISPAGMAVIVQRLVDARCAGVLFTVNPVDGSWREMTIEAAWGLGEAVVSGHVVPDFYRVQRPRRPPGPARRILGRTTLTLIEDRVQPQVDQWVYPRGPGQTGLQRVPVPASRVGAPKLLQADVLRLARLGLRVEATLGGPQDVEWAADERLRFYVLQARPVTTSRDVGRQGPVIWTRRFVGERWTEPATPLGWSIIRDLLDWFIAYPETSRRLLGGEPSSRLVRSAPYFNVTVFRHLAFKLPGMPPPRFMLELLPPAEVERWVRRHAEAPDLRVYASIFETTFRERRWERFRWNLFTNWRAWDQFEARLDDALTGPDSARLVGPVRDLSDARARVVAMQDLAREYVKVHICSLLFANIWYQVAEGALRGAGKAALAPDLLRPPEQNWTGRTNHALWRLGRGALSMEAFLAGFGHRASSSWEMFSARWWEQPDHALLLARAAASQPDPAIRAAEQERRTVAARAQVKGLTGALVDLASVYLRLREDQRFHFDRLLWAWKRIYLWMEGELELSIRFLERAELDALLDGVLSREDAARLIERRARAWSAEQDRRQAGDEPPEFLLGEELAAMPDTGPRIQGLGISPGVVTGPARVLRQISAAGALKPGEILVARATDPGWTPLFLVAGGLVLEQGGLLSHGAVVAREYRVPAVSNVPGATNRLRDGQVLTVDGSRGLVWVH